MDKQTELYYEAQATIASLTARLAEAEERIKAWEYAAEVCDQQYRYALKRLAEAEARYTAVVNAYAERELEKIRRIDEAEALLREASLGSLPDKLWGRIDAFLGDKP